MELKEKIAKALYESLYSKVKWESLPVSSLLHCDKKYFLYLTEAILPIIEAEIDIKVAMVLAEKTGKPKSKEYTGLTRPPIRFPFPLRKNEFPKDNNMGNITVEQAESFFNAIILELGITLQFEITDAGSICIKDKIFIDKKDLQYPWFTKQLILHEIAHYLVPDDYIHGTRFHEKYAELVERFLGKGNKAPKELMDCELSDVEMLVAILQDGVLYQDVVQYVASSNGYKSYPSDKRIALAQLQSSKLATYIDNKVAEAVKAERERIFKELCQIQNDVFKGNYYDTACRYAEYIDSMRKELKQEASNGTNDMGSDVIWLDD